MHTDRTAGQLVRKMSEIKAREIALARLRERNRPLSRPLYQLHEGGAQIAGLSRRALALLALAGLLAGYALGGVL